jgi:precorrin-6A/cobalt-precorrin-6A reductase
MPHVTRPRVLILGGTTEARHLADALSQPAAAEAEALTPHPTPALGGASKPAGYDSFGSTSTGRPATEAEYFVISSLAGRTSAPLQLPGEVRIGGFGGVDGLVDYLRAERIDAVVDATHPFAATMTRHALAAADRTGVPLLVLRRPGFAEEPGDAWVRVPDLAEAAARLPRLGDRAFLTTGRQSLAAFAGVEGCSFLSRSVEMPTPPVPERLEVVLDRGPFTLDGERRLLRTFRANVLVTKDSGGAAPKLVAARGLGLPVLMVDRPPDPPAPTVATVSGAVAWLSQALPKVARQ